MSTFTKNGKTVTAVTPADKVTLRSRGYKEVSEETAPESVVEDLEQEEFEPEHYGFDLDLGLEVETETN